MATDRVQIKEFLDIASEQMKFWMDSIDVEALSTAKKLILDAEANKNRVHVTGIGKPGHVEVMQHLCFPVLQLRHMSCTEQRLYTEAQDRSFREM